MRKEVLADGVELYLADCREVLPSLDRVELVITDPPYSSGARTDSERQVRGAMLRSMEDQDWFSHDAMTTWGFNWFIRSVFSQLRQRLSEGAHTYLFIDWRQTPNVYGMMEACGYRVNHCLVWDKRHFGMGAYWRNQHENIVFASNGMPAQMLDRGMGSVISCPNVSPGSRVHPTEKPVDLLVTLIDAVPGQLVFDPFMGSGSTGVAAVRVRRKFIGCEINSSHFESACKRVASELASPRMFAVTGMPNRQQELFEANSPTPIQLSRIPEPTESIEPGQIATGGPEEERPLMEAKQPGEQDVGETITASARAVSSPAERAPVDPDAVEGASEDTRGHAPPAFHSPDPEEERRRALLAVASGQSIDTEAVRDLVRVGFVYVTRTRLMLTEEGDAWLRSSEVA